MQIYIDADGSPVVNETIHLAKKYQLNVTVVKNYAHHIEDDYAKIISVDVENDSADYYITNHLEEGDIVVTQDYGLAMLALTRKAYPIHQSGKVFNDNNIHTYLERRHVHSQMRKAGQRHQGPKKRTKKDDIDFRHALESLIISLKNK